jgi:hypothetical protein
MNLFGLDKNKTQIILQVLIDTCPHLHLCDEMEEILYSGSQKVSKELEMFLLNNKKAILKYAEFLDFEG